MLSGHFSNFPAPLIRTDSPKWNESCAKGALLKLLPEVRRRLSAGRSTGLYLPLGQNAEHVTALDFGAVKQRSEDSTLRSGVLVLTDQIIIAVVIYVGGAAR